MRMKGSFVLLHPLGLPDGVRKCMIQTHLHLIAYDGTDVVGRALLKSSATTLRRDR